MTNRSKFWLALGALGFFLLASSVAMAFLSDHHWYVTEEIARFFDRITLWVLLVGLLLSIVAGIGMARTLPATWPLRIGLVLIVASVLTVLLAGGPLAILNVHDWRVVLIFPTVVVFVEGAILVLAGTAT